MFLVGFVSFTRPALKSECQINSVCKFRFVLCLIEKYFTLEVKNGMIVL